MTGENTNHAPLITVDEGVTLILRNITFKGMKDNSAPLIKVNAGGKLIMDSGAVIKGNENNDEGIGGGGVSVSGGELIMYDGKISGNKAGNGAGVYVGSEGKFLMSGEKIKISGNEAAGRGAGVYVDEEGIFRMYKGDIIGNKAAISNEVSGGGVYVAKDGSFELGGGNIKGNSSPSGQGGGVAIAFGGLFFMQSGEISGNYTGSEEGTGPGVYLHDGTTFVKTGGTIYGQLKADGGEEVLNLRNFNAVATEGGKGYAVYYNKDGKTRTGGGWYCDKTLGPNDNLDTGMRKGWTLPEGGGN
jgi:hypothetical protein